MMSIFTKKRLYIFLAAVLAVVVLCLSYKHLLKDEDDFVAFNDFREGKILNVVLDFNSADYFLNRGQVEGFSFSLIDNFADFHDITVKYLPLSALEKIRHFDVDIICLRSKNIPLPKGFVYTKPLVSEKFEENPNIVWAVRRHSDSLKLLVNHFITDYNDSLKKFPLYTQYFRSSFSKVNFDDDFHSKNPPYKISSIDDLIRKHAKNLNWDWRLFAALIYKESKFRTDVSSYSGASGIMQLMPTVAENYGIDSNSTVDQHLAAAVKHLKNFRKTLSDSLTEPDKTMFLIASYNAGAGYINMLRASAKEKGINANLWFGNVEELLIERGQWAKHNLNRQHKGNNKAFQAVDYVESILDTYYHYKNLTDYEEEVFESAELRE